MEEDQFNEAALREMAGESVLFSQEIIEPRNWNEQWEQHFDPVIIEDFCAIRAHFHSPVTTVQHEIIITPKMSFGTGHHPTTWLMVTGLRDVNPAGKSVLDFGTGTGILAILSEKLGAEAITAIDNDDWSIFNAAENIENNHCSRIILEKTDAPPPGKRFDIILANINRHVILSNMEKMKQQMNDGGVIIVSGILVGDEKEVEKSAMESKIKIIGHKVRENWVSLLLTSVV